MLEGHRKLQTGGPFGGQNSLLAQVTLHSSLFWPLMLTKLPDDILPFFDFVRLYVYPIGAWLLLPTYVEQYSDYSVLKGLWGYCLDKIERKK